MLPPVELHPPTLLDEVVCDAPPGRGVGASLSTLGWLGAGIRNPKGAGRIDGDEHREVRGLLELRSRIGPSF